MTKTLDRSVNRARECARELRETARLQPQPTLYVCGLNHTRAALALLEHYALSTAQCGELIETLKAAGQTDQILVLSTCNRTEMYAFSRDPQFAATLRHAFIELGVDAMPEAGPPPLYEYAGQEAVRHLFAVGSGLDSLILGENQIKQQLHEAYRRSRVSGADGPELHRLVEAAFRCGKRIRTETELNVGTLCVAKAAVLKAEQTLGSLKGKVCLVIGAGKVGRIAARALSERVVSRLIVVNRTLANARSLARELGGKVEAAGLNTMGELLPVADLIIGAAYAPEMILHHDCYASVARRAGLPERRVCMVDTALPRILDPTLAEIQGVDLFDIEHMEEIVENNRRARSKTAQAAWGILEEEVEKYRSTVQTAALGPAIRRLQSHIDRIFEEELDSRHTLLGEREKATHRRLKQRLLHEAIVEIKNNLPEMK